MDKFGVIPSRSKDMGKDPRVAECVPLCVDLDGTLVLTDTLYESLIRLLKFQPFYIFLIPFWLFNGKAYLKSQISRRTDMTNVELPLNKDVVDFIRFERERRTTVLVTGADQLLAEAVVTNLDLFDQVKGSDGSVNLTNIQKRDWLVERFGCKNFDYIGNERADLVVWEASRNALVVSTPSGISQTDSQSFFKVFPIRQSSFGDFLKLIRAHQWSKNALVFVPFLLEYRFTDIAALQVAVLLFFAFSLLASATYILNDLLDLSADRLNTTKKKRVLASGQIPLLQGISAMFILMFAALSLAVFLPVQLNLVLFVYLLCTLFYSFYLKQKAVLDVVSLAILHTLRVVAGTIAVGAQWSFWLLAFSMFFFFSLASAKRVAELTNLAADTRKNAVGRGYHVDDTQIMTMIGVASGFISILVVALYINSEKVSLLYAEPMILWSLCPVLMYWVGRLWLITSRGELNEDPIVFAIKDRTSIFTVAILATILVSAMFSNFLA